MAARTDTFKDVALRVPSPGQTPRVFHALKCGSLGQCQPFSVSPCDLRCPVQTSIRMPRSRGLCPVVNLQEGGDTHQVITWLFGREGANTSSESPTGLLPWGQDSCAENIHLAGWGWSGLGWNLRWSQISGRERRACWEPRGFSPPCTHVTHMITASILLNTTASHTLC